jgi:hypothetical protein
MLVASHYIYSNFASAIKFYLNESKTNLSEQSCIIVYFSLEPLFKLCIVL